MITEKYQYGQGRILLAPWATAIAANAYQWVGDADGLLLKPSSDKVQHKESYSGQRGTVRSFPIGGGLDIEMTQYQFDVDALARVMRGTVTPTTTGSATGESLGTVAVGDEVHLANPFVSAVVITDSTGSPKTLVEGTDYTLNADFGSLTILNITGYTMPLSAAYTYAGRNTVGILTQGQQLYALRYEEYNLAEGNEPSIVLVHKLAPDLTDQISLIGSGNDVSGMKLTGSALLDSSKSPSGALGQFAAVIQKAAA